MQNATNKQPVNQMAEPTHIPVENQTPKRPDGVAVIAIIWGLASLYNIYTAYQTISADVSAIPQLSNPQLNSWFSFGVPAELILSTLLLILALIQLVVAPGLWTGKSYAYWLALIFPLGLVVTNALFFGLYASAPSELDLGSSTAPLVGAVVGIFWVVIYWQYLRKDYVKAYLGVK